MPVLETFLMCGNLILKIGIIIVLYRIIVLIHQTLVSEFTKRKAIKRPLDSPWEIKIRKSSNGYVLSCIETQADGSLSPTDICIEQHGDEAPASIMRRLCFEILDYFGYFPNKYDRQCLKLYIKHGSDYECQDKKCEICKGKFNA